MSRILPVLFLILVLPLTVAGCGPTIIDPARPDNNGKRNVTPPAAPSAFWSDLADAVEAGDFDSTQQLLKVAALAAKRAKVAFPADYDSTMKPYLDNRHLDRDEDSALRQEIAGKLRGWSK